MKVSAIRSDWFDDLIILNFIDENYIESRSYTAKEWENQGGE